MKISVADKAKLKKPLGPILSIAKIAQAAKTTKLIAVGDVCGKVLIEHGIKPWIWIYDGLELRKPVSWKIPPSHIVAVNPRGNVTASLMRAVDFALKRAKSTKIFVKGEEDLAALYCIATAPEGTLIVYGQQKRGIVVVDAVKKRNFARKILNM